MENWSFNIYPTQSVAYIHTLSQSDNLKFKQKYKFFIWKSCSQHCDLRLDSLAWKYSAYIEFPAINYHFSLCICDHKSRRMPIWTDKVQGQNCLSGKFQKQVWSSVLKYHSLFCPPSQAEQTFLIYLIFSQSSWNFYLHNLYIDKKCCCHFTANPGTYTQKNLTVRS